MANTNFIIAFQTMNESDAGTDAEIWMTLQRKGGVESQSIHLTKGLGKGAFEPNSVNIHYYHHLDLGDSKMPLDKIQLEVKNPKKTENPNWKCGTVDISEIIEGEGDAFTSRNYEAKYELWFEPHYFHTKHLTQI